MSTIHGIKRTHGKLLFVHCALWKHSKELWGNWGCATQMKLLEFPFHIITNVLGLNASLLCFSRLYYLLLSLLWERDWASI
jgi:hypothetical protein